MNFENQDPATVQQLKNRRTFFFIAFGPRLWPGAKDERELCSYFTHGRGGGVGSDRRHVSFLFSFFWTQPHVDP